MKPLIGIILLNYKTYKETIRLTEDLLKFKMVENLRIVIVDNQSPNESFKYLSAKFKDNANVDVIQSKENGGYAKGNNIGLHFLERYQPRYVLVLNNDIYFEEEVLESCILEYERIPMAGAISPVQYLPNNKIAPINSLKCNTFIKDLLQYSILYTKYHKKHKYKSNTEFSNIQQTDIIPGCFVFSGYDRFKEIGFFYEGTFLFCEERFLYKRFNEKGYKNFTIINQHYIHDHSHTINKEVAQLTQAKYLNDGFVKYTKEYRKYHKFKEYLLRIAYRQYVLKIKLINAIKNLFH